MCILLCQFIQRNCNSKLEAAQREPVGSHNNGEVTAFEPVSCFTFLLVSILKLGNTFQFHLRLFLYPSFCTAGIFVLVQIRVIIYLNGRFYPVIRRKAQFAFYLLLCIKQFFSCHIVLVDKQFLKQSTYIA